MRWRSMSSRANSTLSRSMRETSSGVRPWLGTTCISARLPLRRSVALTFSTPLASTANFTSSCGMPAGMGGMPRSTISPIRRQSAAISRSPCSTVRRIDVCPSTLVENISVARAGTVLLRITSFATAPPTVSMPSESGITSSSSAPFCVPARMDACTAAPSATT